MKLGVLHLGAMQHGVRVYGGLVAAAIRDLPDAVDVVEVAVDRPSFAALREAGRDLTRAGVDVVYLQLNPQPHAGVWGRHLTQLAHLEAFLSAWRGPLVATVHDLAPGISPRDRLAAARKAYGLRSLARAAWFAAGLDALLVDRLARRAGRLLVCTEEEALRLRALSPRAAKRVRVVPHLAMQRPLGPSSEARDRLGLAGHRVVTLLGFLHPRKGAELLIDAVPQLPADVVVLLAGRPSDPPYGDALLARARALGVAHRVRLTGYLDAAALDDVVAATDVGACPFTEMSASGTVAVWIGAACPIVGAPLPQLVALVRAFPGLVTAFAERSPTALAAALTGRLDARAAAPGLLAARAAHAPARLAAVHLALFHEALDAQDPSIDTSIARRGH